MARVSKKNLAPQKRSYKNGKLSTRDFGFNRFIENTNTKDLVVMVLKSHLLAEYYLDQLIILYISRGDVITNGRFTFYNKLQIVKALNILYDEDMDAIEGLNALRNDCSHVLDYSIGEKDVDKIGLPYGAEYLELKTEHPENIHELLHLSLMKIVAGLDGYVDIAMKRIKKPSEKAQREVSKKKQFSSGKKTSNSPSA